MTDGNRRTAFDERAALEALDRLQGELERTRKRRREANDAFTALLNGFLPPALEDESADAGRPAGGAVPGEAAEGTRRSRPEIEPRTGGPRSGMQGPKPFAERGVIFALAAVLLAGFVVFVGRDRQSGDVMPQDAGPSAAASIPEPAVSPAAAPPADTAGAELTTVRSVWVRVTVDGERVVERELQAEARVPLAPKEAIVIRAGDGGAVRLSIAGQDQGPLGRDGEVVTRTFAIP